LRFDFGVIVGGSGLAEATRLVSNWPPAAAFFALGSLATAFALASTFCAFGSALGFASALAFAFGLPFAFFHFPHRDLDLVQFFFYFFFLVDLRHIFLLNFFLSFFLLFAVFLLLFFILALRALVFLLCLLCGSGLGDRQHTL
jgi:hypothetical protein